MWLILFVIFTLVNSFNVNNTTVNNTEQLDRFRNHINVLKTLLPHSQLKFQETRSLMLVSRTGVPLHFNGYIPNKDEIQTKTVVVATKVETYYSTMILETDSSEDDSDSTDEELEESTYERDITSDTIIYGESIVTESITTESITININPLTYRNETIEETEKQIKSATESISEPSKQGKLAFEEIKRLENLLFELKQEMIHQQESFRLQMLSIYATKDQVTTIEEPEMTTASVIHQNHGKNVLTQKNPSNSVLIVPQFQNHRNEITRHDYHHNQYHHTYAKPKVAWNEVILTRQTTSGDFSGDFSEDFSEDSSEDSSEYTTEQNSQYTTEHSSETTTETITYDEIFEYSETKKDNLHPFKQPIETGEIEWSDYDYSFEDLDYLFDIPNHLTQDITSIEVVTEVFTEPPETFTVTETATISRRRNRRFKNYNSTINFDVFHMDLSENQGINYKYSLSCWILMWLIFFI